jgi:hypothetical protein
MRTLLDNTFMGLIADVLKSKSGGDVSRSRVLALFHLAEHIMFDEEMTVSNAPGGSTFDQTMWVREQLEDLGVLDAGRRSLLEIRPFELSVHETACRDAANAITVALSLHHPQAWKVLADSARPWHLAIGGGLIDFQGLVARSSEKVPLPDIVDSQRKRDVPAAEAEFMVRDSDKLRGQLAKIMGRPGGMSGEHQLALSALFRLYINQALSTKGIEDGVYAPAPQRVALSYQVNRLLDQAFLNDAIQHREGWSGRSLQRLPGLRLEAYEDSARLTLNDEVSRVLLELGLPVRASLPAPAPLDSFPLPLLGFHLLKSRRGKIQGPQQLLEQARRMRDSDDAKRMRSYLGEWQTKLAQSHEAEGALAEIRSLSEELKTRLGAQKASRTASLRFGVKLFPPAIEAKLDAPEIKIKGVRSIVAWLRHQRFQSQFLASVARTVTRRGEFDRWFERVLDRNVVPDGIEKS